MKKLEYTFEEYGELMRKHHEEAGIIAEKLEVVPGYRNRAERMKNCETYTKGIYCPKCKSFHTVKASLCRDRLCPNCGWALSRKRAKAVLYAVDKLRKEEPLEVIHIVLTLKHDETSKLAEQIDSLMKGFRNLMRRKRMRENMIGYIRAIEVKKAQSGYHPHIHMLYIVNEGYFKNPVTHTELCAMWRKACEIEYSPVVWIKKAYSKDEDGKALYEAIYECVKYAIKTNDWKKMETDELIETAEALYARKLFSVNGNRIMKPYMDGMESDKPEEEQPTPCKKCGSQRYIASISI